MTLEELKAIPQETVSARVAGKILGVSPYSLNVRAEREGLPFRYYFSGTRAPRLHIIRRSLIRYLEGEADT